jgi:magnesium transporter
MADVRSEVRLQSSVADLRRLLARHRLLDGLAARQEGPKRGLLEDLQHRQNAAELQRYVRAMHAADVAYALEVLPLDERRNVWEQVTDEQAAQVFVEVDAVVRESLVDLTAHDTLVRMLTSLDPEDLAYVSDAIPADVLARASAAFASADRTVFEDSRLYQDDSVGFFMTREWVAVPETHTVEHAIRDLRVRGELPPQTDRLFVVDARHALVGSAAQALLVRRRGDDPPGDGAGHPHVRAARRRRRRRQGVRALRSRVSTGRRRARQDRRAAHG